MRSPSSRLWKLAAFAAAPALLLGACSSSETTTSGTTAPGESASGLGEPGRPAAGSALECLSFADLYALVGPESDGITNWNQSQTIATELGSETQFPDLELKVTAPGQESGTYGSFVELALEGFFEERIASGSLEPDEPGGDEPTSPTRTDYPNQANDNAILQGIEGSKGSFGWVGFAFAEEAGDGVVAFNIKGEDGTCVEPSLETIASGEYPLARPMFIYVNTKALQEDPAVACFVDFYLNDGIGLVEEAGYVGLTEDLLGESQAAAQNAGMDNSACTGEVTGTVDISGSSTVEPITKLVQEDFREVEPGVTVNVDGPGTTDGFKLFCVGDNPINDASREIKESEIKDCADNGIEYVALTVGLDGIAVLTNPENPGVK